MDLLNSESDSDSFTDSSDSEYLDDIDSMYSGQAQSILSNLEQSIGRIDDFLAFERGFVHGDIVCSVTNPSGQLGQVVDVDMVVDVETIYGEVIKEINSKKLEKIHSLVVGDYVILGTWLGRVSKVVDRVTILFDDGAKCEVTAGNSDTLVPISPSVIEDSQFPYYPGQRVQVRLASTFKPERWLCGALKENRDEATVCHVEAGLVYVDWVASVMVGGDIDAPAPPHWQEFKNLTLLSCFSHAHWQLGDWCMLSAGEQIIAHEQVLNGATRGSLNGQIKIVRESRKRSPSSCYREIYVIVKRRTNVDILWQDGTHSFGLNSQFLLPVNIVGDHEFWPEQFVLEKGTGDDTNVISGQRYGIVKSMDAKERTVKLKWKISAENQTNDSDEEYSEEIVSAYELIEHPSFCYRLGDIVFRLPKNLQFNGSMECEDHLAKDIGKDFPEQFGGGAVSSKLISDEGYLSFIGNVVGFKDESIEVKWASGLMSKVGPNDIFGIAKYEDLAAASLLHEEEDTFENLTQEISENEKLLSSQNEKEVLDDADHSFGKDSKKGSWESSPFSLPREVIGFLAKVAWSLFGSGGSTSLLGPKESRDLGGCSENCTVSFNGSSSKDENKFGSFHKKDLIEFNNLTNEKPATAVDYLQIDIEKQIEPTQKNRGLSFSSITEKPGKFKQFDMVGDYSDHHFASSAGKGSSLPQVGRGWLKKVHQEWSILEKNLPDTIFVRAYEERIDLLRAAIVGAPGTPYHDGLFFFDFFFPPDYPNEPPLVHYHSGGLRVNPNLYESGRVCLSLLNTWTGTGSEAWNPGSSTILQVLVSLQALVLNEKPYFNEAGYDNQMGRADGEKNSMTYNENAFILSCQTMLYLLCKPPKHFEELVEEHFCYRSQSILLACKTYIEGTPVGSAFDCKTFDQKSQKNSSMGFKITLSKLFPKLVSGFTQKGIDCSQFLELKNESIIK